MTKHISRRNFLKHSGALGAITTVGVPMVMNLLPTDASAAVTDNYKALVCVFLAGGNDAFNMVVRTDSTEGVQRYKDMRPNIRLADGDLSNANDANLLTITGQNNHCIPAAPNLKLKLHPRMPQLKAMFDLGQVALIGNIGPLVKPMTADLYVPGSVDVPPKLFSHNDQQSVWQSGKPEGSTNGWGGELVRRLAANNKIGGNRSDLFSAVAVEANGLFCAGTGAKVQGEPTLPPVTPLVVSKDGVLQPGANFWYGNVSRAYVLDPLLSGAVGMSSLTTSTGAATQHLIEADYLGKLVSANLASGYMATAQAASTTVKVNPAPAGNGLAKQLEIVANFIRAQSSQPLSYARQVFFVQLGGFDTHSDQGRGGAHDQLLGALDEALSYFYTQLGTDGVSKVTTFTASEFGRKLNANGDGSDHGWGGHHFVMGGGVKGGVYGSFPDLSTWIAGSGKYGDTQLLSDGTMVPAVAVDTLSKELGEWLGVNLTKTDPVGGALVKQLFPSAGDALNLFATA